MSHIEKAVKDRPKGFWLLAALIAALAIGLGLYGSGAIDTTQAHSPQAAIRIVAVDPDGPGPAPGLPVSPTTILAVPRDAVVRICLVNDIYDPIEGIDHFINESYSLNDSHEADTSEVEFNSGSQPTARCVEVKGDFPNHTGGRTTVQMSYNDTQGTAATTDDTSLYSNEVHIFWIQLFHLLPGGILSDDPIAVNKPSSFHRIITEGHQLHRRHADCNAALSSADGLPCWRFIITNSDVEIVSDALTASNFGIGADEKYGFICTPTGEPVSGPASNFDQETENGPVPEEEQFRPYEICIDIHAPDDETTLISLEMWDPDQGVFVSVGTLLFTNDLDDNPFTDDSGYFPAPLLKDFDETPIDIVHVQRYPTDVVCQSGVGGPTDTEVCGSGENRRPTSASDRGNDMLSFDADGDGIRDCFDFLIIGPDDGGIFSRKDSCDEPLVDDNWNVIGSAHVVRTDGFRPNFVIDGWQLVPQLGSNVIILAGPGECSLVTQDPDLDFPDGSSLWDSFSPAYQAEITGEQCIAFTSTSPGETFISVQFHDEGSVFESGLGPDDSDINTVGHLIKEWNRLVETHICRLPAFYTGVLNDRDRDRVDDLNDIDFQHGRTQPTPPVCDIEGTTVSIDVSRRLTVLEIVHGEHQTLGGPVDGIGKKVDASGLMHADVDHAIVTVEIDSPRGCTNVVGENETGRDNTRGDVDDEFEGRESGRVVNRDRDGVYRVLEHGGVNLTFSATCEEQARVSITVEYPRPVSSIQEPLIEHLNINWTTVEVAKQPIIKKAGEEHVLEWRWGTPDFVNRKCDLFSGGSVDHDIPVFYTKLGGPGNLLGGWEDLDEDDGPDFIPAFGGIAVAEMGVPSTGEDSGDWEEQACVSRALVSSEDPGQLDVEAVLCFTEDDFDDLRTSGFEKLDCDEDVNPRDPSGFDDFIDKHPFLVWYVKLYSITVTDVPGDLVRRTDLDPDVLDEVCHTLVDHQNFDYNNDGVVNNEDFLACLASGEMDRNRDNLIDEWEARWTPTPNVFEPNTQGQLPSTDVRAQTLNVTDFGLVRVQTKDYLYLANNSSRPDVCLDMDGDGNGTAGAAPGPYRTVSHEGCPDAADELLTAGYWVLPDDFLTLAGAQPANMRGSWNVLFGPPEAAAHFANAQPENFGVSPAKARRTCLADIDLDGDGDADVDYNEDGAINQEDIDDCISDALAFFGANPAQFAAKFLIGPKREIDTHDGVVNEWVRYNGAQIWYFCTGDFASEDTPFAFFTDDFAPNGLPDWIDYDFDSAGECIDEVEGKCFFGRGGNNGGLESNDGLDACVYKSIWPNLDSRGGHIINIWDAIMPLEKITLRLAPNSAGTFVAVDKDVVYPGGINPYYQVFIPAQDSIPAQPGGSPGYDWEGIAQGPYPFWHELQKTLGPAPRPGQAQQVTSMQLYTDNHGEAMALIWGNANLSFADCGTDPITGTRLCDPGDVVGVSTITAIADYPYFRKHRDMLSAPDVKTWVWGGYKRLTLHPVVNNQGVVDPRHTYVVAHLLSRDAECQIAWDGVGPGVRGEPVDFEISGEGVIVDVELDGSISADGKRATGISGNAADFGGTLRFPHAGDPGECQAFILVEHDEKARVQVSVVFHEPEGDIRTSAPVFPSGAVDLEIHKTGPATVNAGENITYTIRVKNAGAFVAHDVRVVDTPSLGNIVSITPPGGIIGTLQPGQEVVVTVVVAVPIDTPDDTVLTNVASVSGAQQDANLANNTATVTTTVQAVFPVVVLFPGWNFVEWKAGECKQAVEAFAQLTNPDIFNVAWTWNAQNQTFDRSFDDDAPPALNTLQRICPGEIIIIHVAQKVDWVQDP